MDIAAAAFVAMMVYLALVLACIVGVVAFFLWATATGRE